MKRPLSKAMAAAFLFAKANGGTLIRRPGGYWVSPAVKEEPPRGWGSVTYFGTATIEGLVDRGHMRRVVYHLVEVIA